MRRNNAHKASNPDLGQSRSVGKNINGRNMNLQSNWSNSLLQKQGISLLCSLPYSAGLEYLTFFEHIGPKIRIETNFLTPGESIMGGGQLWKVQGVRNTKGRLSHDWGTLVAAVSTSPEILNSSIISPTQIGPNICHSCGILAQSFRPGYFLTP